MKRPRKEKLKTTEKILIVCEGKTEESYINQLLKDSNLITANITVDSSAGGGYTNIKNYIERNKTLYSIILIVCDLDRATHKPVEKRNLKALINLIEKENLKNNIFLNNPEIEVWIAASINANPNELPALGYEKGNTVCRFLRDRQGSYERACQYFANSDLYYEKREFKKGHFNESMLVNPHSNLIYFIDYMRKLIRLK